MTRPERCSLPFLPLLIVVSAMILTELTVIALIAYGVSIS